MVNIKSVSELRDYNKVLNGVSAGSPVFLTRNGKGAYVVLDIRDYEYSAAVAKLSQALVQGEESIREAGLLSLDTVKATLGL